MALILTHNLNHTAQLGLWLAANLGKFGMPPLLLKGGLGLGKTTLTRFLAEALPGAEEAEIASPSFTIQNYYPTTPPIIHCDLYRCRNTVPEEIIEALNENGAIVIIEWADYLPSWALPRDYLDITFIMDNDMRRLEIKGVGERARLLENALAEWAPGAYGGAKVDFVRERATSGHNTENQAG